MRAFLITQASRVRSRAGSAKLPILVYHRAVPAGQVTFLPALDSAIFERHVVWLKRHFVPLTLAVAGELSQQGDLPANAIVITVDDGYVDCYAQIFPILRRHGVPATFFIATGGIDQGQLWDERIAQLVIDSPVDVSEREILGDVFKLSTYGERLIASRQLIERLKYLPLQERADGIRHIEAVTGQPAQVQQFLSAEQIRHMAESGMEFGAHTINHPILKLEDDGVARHEIVAGKRDLESILQADVASFAYPNGRFGKDFDRSHIEMVSEAGFRYAVSTDVDGCGDVLLEPLCLGRQTAWSTSESRFLLGLSGLLDRRLMQ